MTAVTLAPNARWQGRDKVGNAIVNGRLYTYKTHTDVPKATFQDPGGMLFNPNPVQLDGKGEASIYWSTDEYYRIELWTAGGKETGQLVYTQDNYPLIIGSTGPVNNFTGIANLIRNPQFTFWHNTTSFPAYTAASSPYDYIADEWTFSRNNNNATVNITRQTFALGQGNVPANPLYFLRYECTSIGAGAETYKRFQQEFDSVQTLANTPISFAFYAKSPTNSTVLVSATQYFGTGGAPSADVETPIFSTPINLTTNWQRFTALGVVLPNVNGKTIGTNNDDSLRINIDLPLNAIATVDICNVQLEPSNVITDFQYLSQDQEFKRLNSQVDYALAKTGDFKFTLRNVADFGWLICNDGTIGSPTSNALTAGWYTKALFELLWNSISNTYAPIYNSDGTISTRGTDAESDFNANKRLALTRTLGRVFASAGQAIFIDVFTADYTTNLLTITYTANYYTGVPVTLATTGTLPAPLALSTTYYVIAIDATHIKLATSQDNAIAGTAIILTDDGTGSHTISIDYSNFVPGQFVGEETHQLTGNEMPKHSHSVFSYTGLGPAGASLREGSDTSPQSGAIPTSEAGGGLPHNNMQPTTFLNCMIKL